MPCATIPNQNILIGRGFATHTLRVAPRVSLLDNALQVFALAEGQYGRHGISRTTVSGATSTTTRSSRVSRTIRRGCTVTVSVTTPSVEIYDASFWKLREVGARYNLPESVIGGLPVERASLAVSARNLWTMWVAQEDIYGVLVTDPEYGTPTVDGERQLLGDAAAHEPIRDAAGHLLILLS